MADDTLPGSPVDRFLEAARQTAPPGAESARLLFALDATASREPTWDLACHLQSEMFETTGTLGGIAVKLCFYRGFGECKSAPWTRDTGQLQRLMGQVRCRGGRTQIAKVLRLALDLSHEESLRAVVFIGDAMEEPRDRLADLAGRLALVNTPVFVFQEGHDPLASATFREIASLSGGAWFPFDHGSAGTLKDLLGAVAVFAAGGAEALEDHVRARPALGPAVARLLPGRR